jgi:hypothetical protein
LITVAFAQMIIYGHLMLLPLRLMLLAFLMTKKLLPLSRAVFRTNPGKPYRME